MSDVQQTSAYVHQGPLYKYDRRSRILTPKRLLCNEHACLLGPPRLQPRGKEGPLHAGRLCKGREACSLKQM